MELLFLGDSLIEFYDWQKRFPTHSVVNCGRSGETVQELVVRCYHIPLPIAPKWIFVMIGTNNILMEDFSFFSAYEEIVLQLIRQHPQAHMVLTGLFPMPLPWLSNSAIHNINIQLHHMAKHHNCLFMNGAAIFKQKQSINSCFGEDGVHLSNYGYELWAEAIEKLLVSSSDKKEQR